MSRRLSTLVVALVITATVVVPSGPASAATPADFAGTWTSVDVVDGSDQVLRITPGRRLLLVDDSATACAGAPAVVTGGGLISGDDLVVTLRLRCVGGGGASGIPATFTYDAGTDTLTDSLGGTVWTRTSS